MAVFERKILVEKCDIMHCNFKCEKCGYYFIINKQLTKFDFTQTQYFNNVIKEFNYAFDCPKCKKGYAVFN